MLHYRKVFILLLTVILLASGNILTQTEKPKIAFSFDDGNVNGILRYRGEEWNAMIREALKTQGIKSVWFVTGESVDNPKGRELLNKWNTDGHLIANHTYSHYNYNSRSVDFEKFTADIDKNDSLINGYGNYVKSFRFPYLKSGSSVESRDSMRNFLSSRGYRQGWVTIDASDWYINSRMIGRLKENPDADISEYRDYYLKHMFERANYYNDLSKEMTGRQIAHTALLHFNLTSALFLNDLIEKFRNEGWEVINYSDAVKDPVYNILPGAMPAEQSLVWLMGRETGKYENRLRYPGEDSEYEKENMDRLGL